MKEYSNDHCTIRLIQGDCREGMKSMKENQFDLAIVDPPYGIGESGGDKKRRRKKNNHKKIVNHVKKEWDSTIPKPEYFKQLFRCSKNQIIWGGNYFVEYLQPKMGWVFWEKLIGGDFSDGELAFTSFQRALKLFKYSYHGDSRGGWTRIHPTQKPVALYKWLLKNYAKEGDTILDTHGGSMSIAIACWDMGYDLTLYELDEDYYKAGVKRFEQHIAKPQLFEPKEMYHQQLELIE